MASSERFGYEWSKFDKIVKAYESQFLKWVFPFKKKDFKDKIILDAGCGTGRNSYWPLKYGASEIYAFDLDKRTVDVAIKNLSRFQNAKVKKDSIYNIKFKDKFDIAFSIGVIHHLKKPHVAIKNMIKSLKSGGKILLWVYGYEGNEWIVKYINPLRKITSKLPLEGVHFLTYLLSIPLWLYLRIFPQKHPYFKQLSKFKLWHIHSIAFDQLIPEVANYWTKDEAYALLDSKGLKDIQVYPVNKNSWTVIGTKE